MGRAKSASKSVLYSQHPFACSAVSGWQVTVSVWAIQPVLVDAIEFILPLYRFASAAMPYDYMLILLAYSYVLQAGSIA